MSLDLLLNARNHLSNPLNEEFTSIEPLRCSAMANNASLSQHTEYNIAFEHTRKKYEQTLHQLLTRIDESFHDVEKQTATKRQLMQEDTTDLKQVETECMTLEQQISRLTLELSVLDQEARSDSVDSARDSASVVPSAQELTLETQFYQAHEDALMNARTCMFRLKNKISTPHDDEIQSVRAQGRELRTLLPTPTLLYQHEEALQQVEHIVDDVLVRVSVGNTGDAYASEQAPAMAEKQRDDFMKESMKLLQWCRQQKTDLEALTEPDHIQKFCSALEMNYKTMYDNFEMLSTMGLELTLKHPDSAHRISIEQQLMECNEVWLNLLIYAHEILQHTMLEIHARSKLEDEVRAFSNYSTRFHDLLHRLRNMFTLPMDEESKDVVAGILNQTDQLLQAYEPFAHLTEDLKDFSLRMECIRDNYQNLRRTVFSRLTFLTPQSHTQALAVNNTITQSRRQEDYKLRIQDLNEWVQKKEMGETCTEIHARVESIKKLIDTELEHLQTASIA